MMINLVYWFCYFLTFYLIINESWMSAFISLLLVWMFDDIKETEKRRVRRI